MPNNDFITSFMIPKSLVNQSCTFYQTENASEAIRKSIIEFLLLPKSEQRIDHFPLHQLCTIAERLDRQKLSIRLPKELVHILASLSDENLQDTVMLMLATVLYYASTHTNAENKTTALLKILGSKWRPEMQNAIRQIFESCNIKWATSVEPCVGALGIHANFSVAENEIINDDDWRKVNLYKAIKEDPHSLILALYALNADKETFDQIKKVEAIPSAKMDINAAANFLFLNLTSYRHTGNTFSTDMNTVKFRKSLSGILPLHRRLQHSEISEIDIFKIIRKYEKKPDTIFLIDPNYLNANVYQDRIIHHPEEHGKSFGLEEHTKLAAQLRRIKNKFNNHFIYFCRTTVTRTKGKHCLSEDALRLCDRDLHGYIDDLYYGYGFYYIDVMLENGIIERIITSFDFKGATLYGDKRTYRNLN